jgi:D-sedoheptulose 7-phosphate isomerase
MGEVVVNDAERVHAELAQASAAMLDVGAHVDQVLAIASLYRATLAAGGTLFFAGNGGSAADAQHVAAEYVVGYGVDRRPLRAVALTTDTSVLTAAGNDRSFDEIFTRQVEALGRPGDVLTLHSTTGQSTNLMAAAWAARERRIVVVALLGRGGGHLKGLASIALVVDSDNTQRIQEVHLALQHIIRGLI